MHVSRNKSAVLGIIGVFVVVLALSDCTDSIDNNENNLAEQDTVPLTKHWEKAIPNQNVPEGLTSLKAEDCGNCHREIYEEWKLSTHALAFKDMQFQAEWEKDDIYACLNCHTPLQNQQKFIVSGLINGDYKNPLKKTNPKFDKALQLEGITCASCHVRNGNVIGTIGSTNAPHKIVKDVEFLSESLCISCHNVVDEMTPVLACSFETGDEWKDNWAIEKGKNCISCHMPEKQRPLVTGYEERSSHSHAIPGSGIPKEFGMDINGLEGLEIKADSLKNYYSPGDQLNYALSLKNSFAGHKVPTGDPERFFLIRFTLKNAKGNTLEKMKYRIGEKWQWHPEAKKLSDNNLKPLEERTFDFSFQVPDKKGMTLGVEVTKHRMTKENAETMGILHEYPLSIEVFEKQHEIKIE